jgi:membrane protease YdiL (CAAX protease family)
VPTPNDTAAPSPATRLLREVLGMFGVSLAATVVLYRLRGVSLIGDNLHALVGTVFLLLPILLLQRRGEDFERFGIALGGLLGGAPRRPGLLGLALDLVTLTWKNRARIVGDVGFAIALGCLIFPPFVLGFQLYWQPTRAFTFVAPDGFWGVALAQLVVVGLPEEFFYRGYVQTRLHEVFPRTVRVLGTDVSPLALLVTSTLFALGHFLVDLDPGRLAVFFPSFLFGWIRQRRGSIGAGAIFHAMCNVIADVLMIGYFRARG